MAVYLNFSNKSLQIYSRDKQDFSSLKKFSQNILESDEKEENLEEQEVLNEDSEVKLNDENVKNDLNKTENNNLSNNEEKSKNEVSEKNSKGSGLDFSEPNAFRWKFENLTSMGLKDFISNLNSQKSDKAEIPQEVLNSLKKGKQFLVLPDEIIAFDEVVVPSLNPWKLSQALKLRLEIEYKNIQNLRESHKVISRVKPNACYSIQLVDPKIVKSIVENFTNLGLKVSGLGFYSDILCNFYSSHLRGAKNGAIVVKVSEYQTTILAIVHNFVVATETLHLGEKELYKNSTYRFGEYSRRSIAHKYICFSVSNITKNSSEPEKSTLKKVTREQIERLYSKNKTNPLAGNFQSKSLYVSELIRKKIDDMRMFLASSSLNLKIDKIFIDVKNNESFKKLNLKNSVKVYYSEYDIFKSGKSNKMLKSSLLASKFTNNGFSWSSLWGKTKKEG